MVFDSFLLQRESKEAEEDVEAVVAHDDEHSLCEVSQSNQLN